MAHRVKVCKFLNCCDFRYSLSQLLLMVFVLMYSWSLALTEVDIDIKLGNDPNSIHCYNRTGLITVAGLSAEDFDAEMVDHITVISDGAGEMHRDANSGDPRRQEERKEGGMLQLTCNPYNRVVEAQNGGKYQHAH